MYDISVTILLTPRLFGWVECFYFYGLLVSINKSKISQGINNLVPTAL